MQTAPTVIIGCGPAGLTAAYELAKAGRPVEILEQDGAQVGGLSRTVDYKGFRFDIGGHRFYSKSREIEELWDELLGSRLQTRARLSRIYFRGKFFKYPLELHDALTNLGFGQALACGWSYAVARVIPRRASDNFEGWMVATFGRRLFEMFFKTYTEKVWGVSCKEISSDWGAQRIRGLTLGSILRSALRLPTRGGRSVKTLADRFRYPALGPGEVWQAAAARVRQLGGRIQMGERVIRLIRNGRRITSVVTSGSSGERTWPGEHFLSTMAIADLVPALDPPPPAAVKHAACSLKYRDFMVVAMILDQPSVFPDQWIYVHDPRVKVARIQNFKNWSAAMVPDPRFTMLGLEYFCAAGDGLWETPDDRLLAMAQAELAMLGLAGDCAAVRRRGRPPAQRVSGLRPRLPRQRSSRPRVHQPRRDQFATDRPQRDAQVQQSGPRDDDRSDGSEKHHGRVVRPVARELRCRVPGRGVAAVRPGVADGADADRAELRSTTLRGGPTGTAARPV